MPQLHDAASEADVELVQKLLNDGADVNERDDNGFTPLLRAAAACDNVENPKLVAHAIRLLLANGAAIEDAIPDDGRTAVYLAAEFAPTVEPVQELVDAGASLRFKGGLGENLIDNAWCDDTKALLTRLTGKTGASPLPEPPTARLGKKAWAEAQSVLDVLFDRLNKVGIVAEQDCGTTQDDAYSDCAEIFRDRIENGNRLVGICFYTFQDLNRAKRSAQLNLGIWGADSGGADETIEIGNKLKDAAKSLNLPLHWNGKADTRPMILLNHFKG